MCIYIASRPVRRMVEGITPLQQSLETAVIHDTSLQVVKEPAKVEEALVWVDIDEAEKDNHLYSPEYTVDIYQYMYRREVRGCVR